MDLFNGIFSGPGGPDGGTGRKADLGAAAAALYKQANYINENFPGSVQTQVTGVNDNGVTVGFWAPSNNANG